MKIPHNCILYQKTYYLLYAFRSSVIRVQQSDFRDLALKFMGIFNKSYIFEAHSE